MKLSRPGMNPPRLNTRRDQQDDYDSDHSEHEQTREDACAN